MANSYGSFYANGVSEILNPPFIIAILLALTVHEWAHAYAATKLGDPTAYNEGRLTLNPIAHLDPLGTLMFFFVHFGWGKPVPVNPSYFRHPLRDNAIVALAGPVSNLLLAILAFVILSVWQPSALSVASASGLLYGSGFGANLSVFAAEVLANVLFINLALMAFNLLPIAPLDGSKVIAPFIPVRYQWDYERFMQMGPIILIGLLIAERALNIPILLFWMEMLINGVLGLMILFL